LSVLIKAENISKIYRLGEIGTGTISRDMERFVRMSILNQEDPFLKIGETNSRDSKGQGNIVYSLKDINFEINEGEAIGIIGKNGAGKSTLLKILSRVTSPSTGKINIKGRVASLLEVGTGFHPELTGRENIYLNGAILGMRKKEITKKLDEIIDFSGVERYVDTPVKRYSSGMYVRLAFAVAAHLESEILIVDEVLAVGDAEFQEKCLGKMGEVSKGQGRTVLFVSHNMEAIQMLCQKSMLLEDGMIRSIDQSHQIINLYLKQSGQFINQSIKKERNIALLQQIHFEDRHRVKKNTFQYNEPITLIIEYLLNEDLNNSIIWFDIRKGDTVIFASADTDIDERIFITRQKGRYRSIVRIDNRFLNTGNYNIVIGINGYKPDIAYDRVDNLNITIIDQVKYINPEFVQRIGFLKPTLEWTTEKDNC
jgi:lipopolysaccharide transport system ATP-binding protein